MEYNNIYHKKGLDIDLNYNKNEFGETFLISAQGKYKHNLEITKDESYSICWECIKENEGLININVGIEVTDVLEFESKIISDYISEPDEFDMTILKELRVLELEIKNIHFQLEQNQIKKEQTIKDDFMKDYLEQQKRKALADQQKKINISR